MPTGGPCWNFVCGCRCPSTPSHVYRALLPGSTSSWPWFELRRYSGGVRPRVKVPRLVEIEAGAGFDAGIADIERSVARTRVASTQRTPAT